jgi:hypothetical protein
VLQNLYYDLYINYIYDSPLRFVAKVQKNLYYDLYINYIYDSPLRFVALLAKVRFGPTFFRKVARQYY